MGVSGADIIYTVCVHLLLNYFSDGDSMASKLFWRSLCRDLMAQYALKYIFADSTSVKSQKLRAIVFSFACIFAQRVGPQDFVPPQ